MSTAAIAALPRRPPPAPRLLQRCLLLAVLLHVWLVLVFGNATGSAAPGQGVWGSLTVKLLGRSGGEAGAPPADSGAVATPGRGNPREVAHADDASDTPTNRATLDLPEGFRPVERENLSPPPPRVAPAESLAAELPSSVGRLEAPPEAATTALPPVTRLRPPTPAAETPPLTADLPAPVQRLESASPAATGAAATLPRPAELRAMPAPAAVAPGAELPPPVRRLEAPTENRAAPALPRAAELRSMPPSTATLPPPTAALPSAVQRLEAPAGDSAAATLPRASELRPAGAAQPPMAALPSAQDLPAAVRRLESTDAASTVAPMQTPANARMDAVAPAAASLSDLSNALPGSVAAPAGPARGDPNANPYAAPKASPGSPDAGPRASVEAALPPTPGASAPRAPLNLSLPRGDIGARRGPGLVELLPQPPERKSKLEQSIEDAANKDCRKAYSNAGILAAVPLAIDAARGKGCKW